MTEFKKGDRVRIKMTVGHANKVVNQIGTVIAVEYDYVSIQFGNYINGHNGIHSDGKPGYCWNVPIAYVERFEYPIKERIAKAEEEISL